MNFQEMTVPGQETTKKLVLIDAMSLVFRAFFAPMQMSLVSPSGMPTKAVYIFARTLLKLLRDHRPDYVAAAFDLAAPTFRDKLFEEYKANRPPFPEDLAVQLPYVRRMCKALGLPLAEKEGFEADDVIGTLAAEGGRKGMEVFIFSGDEDLFQLVEDRVWVVKPSRSASDGETICDAAKVKEIIGVEPGQVVDWLALTGDPSDNIPGARPLPGQEALEGPGGKKRSYIGPKGATEIIQAFGTLEKALDNWQDEKKIKRASYREALRDFREQALLSKKLARIRTDVPLGEGAEALQLRPRNFEELRTLCQELGFNSLLRDLAVNEPAASAETFDAQEIRKPAELHGWFESASADSVVAVSFEVEGEAGFGGSLCQLGFADPKRAATFLTEGDGKLLEAAAGFLGDGTRAKSVHNSKLLRLLLAKSGFGLGGANQDTLIYAFLLEPLASSYELSDVVVRRFGATLSSSLGEAAERTRQLAAALAPEIEREGLKKLYEEIELPLARVLADVEAAGVRIEPKILAGMSAQFDTELTALTQEIHTLAGEPFDIDSPKQLGEILFGKLKLPGGKKLRRSGQYSTAAGVLELLAESHELPRKVLDYRTRAKLKSTYIDALPKYINPMTGRLHTSFNQAGSRTGRLSSSNPNLQNIPIGDEFGMRIRSAFVADKGSLLISADYSQIELRVLAHMSEDPVLIEAFSRGEDIHARTAQEIFGVPAGLQTHEHRRMAKAINYGVIYGLSSFGLAGRTGTSKAEAQQYIDAYFARYSKVKEFLDAQIAEARQTGRVRTLFGRLRPIPEINSSDFSSRNRAEREAMNTPLQGTAADLLKLAMVKVHDRLNRQKLRTRMILTVHDELVFEAPEAEAQKANAVVREEMEGVFKMRVPLKVDVGVGMNWRDAK